MALRLTSNSLPATAPHENSLLRAPAALADAARAALATGDRDRYQKLAEDIAGIDDENRRYHLRCRLVEAAFAAAPDVSAPAAREALLLAAGVAVGALEEHAAEPVLLNLAGVALYELWSLDAARALFKAALALDPTLPHAKANLEQLGRRGRTRAGVPLHPAVPELARRAKRVATQAEPAVGLRLSLCMIVKDEEEMLPRALAAAAPAVDEIIVVDTGSTDRTVEIAQSFGAKVLHHTWTGSFADARNVSFDAADGEWIIYLDADEVLVGDDIEKLRSLTSRTWREAFYFAETNYTGDAGDGTAVSHNALRMFRNRPQYRFQGRLHEQIAQTLPSYSPERIEHCGVRIEHYGYLGAVRDAKEKSRRNIELLRRQQREVPDNAFLRFNLGSEHCAVQDYADAAKEFERAWALMEHGRRAREYPFSSALVSRLALSLRGSDRAEEAIAFADSCLKIFPGFTDLVFEQGMAAAAMNQAERAVAYFELCTKMGEAPREYTATRGTGTYLPRLALADIAQKNGDYDRARDLLDWCLREYPGFAGSILPYATTRLRSGSEPLSVVAEIEERVQEMTPTVRFMLGTALYEVGASDAAEQQFKRVLETYPGRPVVRVALGEALLAQRKWAESAAVAAEVDDAGPIGAMSARTQLFALLAGRDLQSFPAAFERAAKVGLPAPEAEVFAAWAELVSGCEAPRHLSPATAELIETMLEALLRVQEFEVFEQTLPLLSHCGLTERDRHERLAAMYFRRGFLQSAAEEWMGVCETTPDARALLGLARVASAHGLSEDAALFAGEALTLQPGMPEAAQLLDRLAVV